VSTGPVVAAAGVVSIDIDDEADDNVINVGVGNGADNLDAVIPTAAKEAEATVVVDEMDALTVDDDDDTAVESAGVIAVL
jgi:AAA+ superfamily predicted ATPase